MAANPNSWNGTRIEVTLDENNVGEYKRIEAVSFDTEWDENHYQKSFVAHVEMGRDRLEAQLGRGDFVPFTQQHSPLDEVG